MRPDPRIRQTWNQFSQNLESANESAQVNLFTFSQRYIRPCFASVNGCIHSCTASCFPHREDRLRRNRGRGRGRAEYNFDFYDDWETDDSAADGLLGLGNEELDRLLAGSSAHHGSAQQPGRQRAMSYGARRDKDGRLMNTRRKAGGPPPDAGPDPTIIPSSSMFGFLGRLPWNMGRKGLKYRPSAADLQDRSITGRGDVLEAEPLLEDGEGVEEIRKGMQPRGRSDTAGSGSASDSIRSRADLFPSEDEDDAVPLDDEFAMVLERRTTGSGGDDQSSAKRQGRLSSGSRTSTKTESSEDTRRSGEPKRSSASAGMPSGAAMTEDSGIPTLDDLKGEEDAVRKEEEEDLERKRRAAMRLASKRGLSADGESIVCV